MVDTKPSTYLFAFFFAKSYAIIVVFLSLKGILWIDQGMPLIFALIYIRILFTMDIKLLPLEIVEDKITWLGIAKF